MAIEEPNTNTTQAELAPTTESQTSLDKVMEALQSKVLGEGGITTSEDTGFEKAIAGIKEAGVATGQRLESQAEREIDYATQQANAQRTTALEGRRGFGQQKVALKLLEESNIKYIGDLQRQKDDALLANDAQTAIQVAGLQVEAMRYEQQEKQNYFTNLMSVGQMAMSHTQLQEQIKMNAQTMSQFDWQKTMDQASMDFQQSKFDYEKIHNKSILNLQRAENKLREQELMLRYDEDINKVQPDEGFFDVEWQWRASQIISPMQMELASDIEKGLFTKDEIEGEMDRIIRKVRNSGISIEAASDEAIRKMLYYDLPEEREGWFSRTFGGEIPSYTTPSTVGIGERPRGVTGFSTEDSKEFIPGDYSLPGFTGGARIGI